mmetsp:Transcript_31264/g.47871  ORF Transcript_31264/g.47871 Transcript_31264/m.47871 type:complete len:90 (-) Transcript_31264:206-475(-)
MISCIVWLLPHHSNHLFTAWKFSLFAFIHSMRNCHHVIHEFMFILPLLLLLLIMVVMLLLLLLILPLEVYVQEGIVDAVDVDDDGISSW